MSQCPYCGGSINEDAYVLISLSRKQRDLFNYVLDSGMSGVELPDILGKFFVDQSPTTLRTMVYNINRKIEDSGVSLSSHVGRYRVVGARRLDLEKCRSSREAQSPDSSGSSSS